MSELIEKMKVEVDSIEWDAIYSMKGHFNAAMLWSWSQRVLGIASILAVTASSSQFYGDTPLWGTIWAFLAATLTAVITFLKPEEKAQPYHMAGTDFGALRRRTRMLKELELEAIESNDERLKRIHELGEEVRKLNQASPQIPFLAYQITRWSVRRGEHTYNEADETK